MKRKTIKLSNIMMKKKKWFSKIAVGIIFIIS